METMNERDYAITSEEYYAEMALQEEAKDDYEAECQMNLIERIKADLIRRFTKASWNAITITMKETGAKITLTPVSTVPNIKSLKDVEYILSNCSEMDMTTDGTLDDIADVIANYNDRYQNWFNNVVDLFRFWTNNIINVEAKTDEALSTYSDWHKSLFNYRPHGTLFNPYNNFNVNDKLMNISLEESV